MLRKILIANRGEIAVRILRTCRELGIRSVAVYSDIDRDALHVQLADEARRVGPPPAIESYLSIPSVLDAARAAGADAIHPGYGFLSENPEFARAVRDAGLVFIGPPAETIELAGDKVRARKVASEAGAPILPAIDEVTPGSIDPAEVERTLGLPVLVKAAAGGGGKGMRVVREPGGLTAAIEGAAREAAAAFGDGRLFLEALVERPRHVEVQILADAHGTILHLGERECSLQRRHQKIVEEAPSPAVDADLRKRLTDAALAVGRALGYVNAGTVEFLVAPDGRFFFLEVNPRLQVEHPVTELVTGIDLVVEQIRIAAGEALAFDQKDVRLSGHAIECRLYAEDPEASFLPSSGTIEGVALPSGPGIRVDTALWSGATIPLEYDPLLAKIIAAAGDRETARRRMIHALEDFLVLGPPNNLRFLRDLVELEAFATGSIDTQLIERLEHEIPDAPDRIALGAAVAAAFVTGSGSGNDRARRDVPSTPWQELGGFRLGERGRV